MCVAREFASGAIPPALDKWETNTRRKDLNAQMNNLPLLTIYGARITKKGDAVNVSLIDGEGEKKIYRNVCVKLGDYKGNKTSALIDPVEKCAVIKVKLFNADAPTRDKDDPRRSDDDLPF